MNDQLNRSSGKRLLLTGAAGFVGVNLALGLKKAGYEVHSTVRPGSDLWRLRESGVDTAIHEIDLRFTQKVDELFEEIQPAVVVHAAAAGGHNWDSKIIISAFQSTVGGTFNVLQASANGDIEKFIHIGSSLVYGKSDSPHRENDERKPICMRGVQKHSAALLAKQVSNDRNLNIIDLILFRVYGAYEQRDRFIPQAILKSLNGGSLPLTEPGIRRSYVHVEDVVEACLLATKSEITGFNDFNIATEKDYLNEEVIEMIEGITGKKINVQPGSYPTSPIDSNYWKANISKASQILGWKPSNDFKKGLQRTIEWYKSDIPEYYMKEEATE